MLPSHRSIRTGLMAALLVVLAVPAPIARSGVTQVAGPVAARATYDLVRAFALTGGVADVTDLTLQRDRVAMTFTGTFYFAAPIGGRATATGISIARPVT